VLLTDIRLAAQSAVPQVRLLGQFVRERVLRGSSHADLLDPKSTPDNVVIDLSTVQLLEWIVMREALFDSARKLG